MCAAKIHEPIPCRKSGKKCGLGVWGAGDHFVSIFSCTVILKRSSACLMPGLMKTLRVKEVDKAAWQPEAEL